MDQISIICPKCQASYKVPAAAIPAGGREVQCSSCGHNWYQLWTGPEATDPLTDPLAGDMRLDRMRASLQVATDGLGADTDAEAEGFGEMPVPSFAHRIDTPAVDPSSGVRAAAEVGQTEDHLPNFQPQPSLMTEEAPELDLPLPPRRRSLDPTVEAVLRAEAAVETQARRREAGLLPEMQEELPLPPRPKRSRQEVHARLAKLQEAERRSDAPERWGSQVEAETEEPMSDPVAAADNGAVGFRPLPPLADPGPSSQPKRAPRDRSRIVGAAPGSDGRGDRRLPAPLSARELAAIEERKARRGFRIGFGVPVALAAAAVGFLLVAPVVIDQVPAAAPVLSDWVAQGERLQTELAFEIRDMVDRLTNTP